LAAAPARRIGALRNLGPKSVSCLAEIGIHDEVGLRATGAVEAYARLKFRFGRSINRNMLFALAAALAGIDWRALAPEHRAELLAATAQRLSGSDGPGSKA
jgi:DNA transformation protein and related proteins